MGKWFPPQASTAERTGLTPDDGSIFYDEDEQTMYIGDGSTVGGNTLKGDQGIQGPPGTLTAVVDDTSPQLGGFLDPNGNYIGFDKGSDIASASPLVIGVDGNFFDVTGSTGFSTMTVVANRFFMLRFTGILTITNGVPITIPGALNFTTAIGDQFLCFSTAIDTVKIIAVTKIDGTAVATNLSADLTPQLSGFLNPNGHYIGSGKGGDIASASPLVIGIDGDHFDVTGTTGFSEMTVAANRNFTLQFDGILIITVGSGITLNNAGGNFTTAPGDTIEFQSTAVNTVVGTISKADGTSPVVSGGAWVLVNSAEADDDATLTITSLDSTYDMFAIGISDLKPVSNNVELRFRVGDSGGIDLGASDYGYHTMDINNNSSSYGSRISTGDSYILLCSSVGNDVGEGVGAMLYLPRPGDGTMEPLITGNICSSGPSGNTEIIGGSIIARRMDVILLDRVQIFFATGNIQSGRLTVWGINHG